MANKSEAFGDQPGWLFCALLSLLHFASVKLTLLCGVTPEDRVVVWLSNAVLLAALMRFNGRRAPLLAALTFCSDVLANMQAFTWSGAALLGVINLVEVTIAYQLIRLGNGSFRLQRPKDLIIFILAGPVAGALVTAFIAAAVIQQVFGSTAPYLTLTYRWWFGNGLGLLIYTPLLLAFSQAEQQQVRLKRIDAAALGVSLGVMASILSAQGGEIGGVPVSLSVVAIIAFRCGIRTTTLAVALISLATATITSFGFQPFGDVPVDLQLLRVQKFILTLCVVGIGFAVLRNELQSREPELE